MSAAFRVVQVYKSYPPVRGGVEGHIDLLTRLLVRRGIESEVLCARSPGTASEERRAGVHVRRCAAPLTLASTPVPPLLPWALRRSEADIVHLHFPWPPNEVAWLLGGGSRPLVVTVHCEVVRYPWLARLLSPLSQTVLRAARRIIVTGEFMRDAPLLAAHRERVRLVPFGVDLDQFRPDPTVPDPAPEAARPRIVFVGQLRHYKGLPVLAAALSRVPGAQLVVVGDGPERAAFERALRDHGCGSRAWLLGTIDDDQLVRVLQTSDAAVLPATSRAEAFGICIAEAQACGLPAVTTDVGTGTTQTVANHVSGRIVRAGDPTALADALRWCIDPAHARERSLAARAHAEAKLNARRMVDQIQQIYEEIL